jgi:hypothetical protein
MCGTRLAANNQPAIAPMMQIKKTTVLERTKPASKRSHAESIDPRIRPTVITGRHIVIPSKCIFVAALLFACAGCAKFGYTDRVLHRVASPDGQVVAVCQEVPVFDGPEFDVRLERRDGSVIRDLFHMGDGGGCGEVVWSGDGRTLAVLTSHVANITIVDAQWALSHPEVLERHWFTRGFSFSPEGFPRQATALRFLKPSEVEFKLCDYSIEETQRSRGRIRCAEPARLQRLRIPSPLVAGRAS